MAHRTSLVDHPNFIIATRDSGYKDTASALAELVDNAIEAAATKIEIIINKGLDEGEMEYEVLIIDNGKGMTADELKLALQFGGSSRFNSRSHLGRYGMGLPNSSLSQCRRVEVITWQKKGDFLSNYLDVDEVVEQKLTKLPKPQRIALFSLPIDSRSGTIIKWSKCDRLSFKYIKALLKHLHLTLGQIFRYSIWQGVVLLINSETVSAFDPLFQGIGRNLTGGIPYGDKLSYQVKVPGHKMVCEVKVRFIELPVEKWATWTNEEKKKKRIIKNAGVSVLRSEREIDYGWYFMGDKRKENYDDWWRCEISFPAQLDEVFGVSHTKQKIKQTEFMNSILVPDLEQTAKVLNNRVRNKFIELKSTQPYVYSKTQVQRTDVYLPPIKKRSYATSYVQSGDNVMGLKYKIIAKELNNDLFFDVVEKDDTIVLLVNKNHLFYDKVFRALHDQRIKNVAGFIKILELVLFAAARAEFSFSGKNNNETLLKFKERWSDHLKTIIS